MGSPSSVFMIADTVTGSSVVPVLGAVSVNNVLVEAMAPFRCSFKKPISSR